MMRAIARPQAPFLVGLLFLPAAFLSRSTDGASLTLMLLSGAVWVATAMLWATNAHEAWSRSLAWARDRPLQRLLLSGQLGRTSTNPAVRVRYVMIAAVFGLVQIGFGVAGLVAAV